MIRARSFNCPAIIFDKVIKLEMRVPCCGIFLRHKLPSRAITWCYLTCMVMAGISCNSNKQVYHDRDIISGTLTVTDSLLIYATWHNSVRVEAVNTGRLLFNTKTADKCYSQPVLKGDSLFFPFADSLFVCRSVKTGQLIWKSALGGRCSRFYMSGKTILANSKDDGLVGISTVDGNRLFKLNYTYGGSCTLPDISPYRATYDKERFYVFDWQCKAITAVGAGDGKPDWVKLPADNIDAGNGTITSHGLFAGFNREYKSGKIMLLNPANRAVLYEEDCPFEQNFDPVLYNGKVYFYAYDKTLHEFDPGAKTDKVIFKFDEENDVSGHQMFLHKGIFYFNGANSSVYALDARNFKIKVMAQNVKAIYGVAEISGRLTFIY